MTTIATSARPSFGEAFLLWLKIGCINFGGPAGQIALMHRILVDEKKWVDEARFLHALNFCMLLPGPEAQKLATYLGWLLHGVRGGLERRHLFVLPGAFVMLGLSLLYALGRGIPLIDGALFGIKAAVLVIVIEALFRIGKRALKSSMLLGLAAAAFVGIFFLMLPFPLIVAAAALVGYVVARRSPEQLGLSGEARKRAAGGRQSLAPLRHRIRRRPRCLDHADRARGRHLRSAPCPRQHRRVFLKACGRELRRRLRVAGLHGAGSGADLRLDDRAGNGRWPRTGRNHAGPLDPGHAVCRFPRSLP